MGMQRHHDKVMGEREHKRATRKYYRTWERVRNKRRRMGDAGFKNTRSNRYKLIVRILEKMNTIRMMRRWRCKSIVEYHKKLYGENYRKTFNKWGD